MYGVGCGKTIVHVLRNTKLVLFPKNRKPQHSNVPQHSTLLFSGEHSYCKRIIAAEDMQYASTHRLHVCLFLFLTAAAGNTQRSQPAANIMQGAQNLLRKQGRSRNVYVLFLSAGSGTEIINQTITGDGGVCMEQKGRANMPRVVGKGEDGWIRLR